MEPTYLQRLSFIKYLFSIGLDQSRQAERVCATSILPFHDSIELFFRLSLEKLNISTGKEPAFMEHFDIIDNQLKDAKLSQKEGVRRLDKARGNLKHLGVTPSRGDIKSFRYITLAFFRENCPTIFRTNFDDISLLDMIEFERSRGLLKQAKVDFDKGSVPEALKDLALSFEYLIRDYEESKKDKFHESPFFFGKPTTQFDSFHLGRASEDAEFKHFVDKVAESLEAIQKAIKILSFGIDYNKYVKYRLVISSVHFAFSEDGTPRFYFHGETILSKEDLKFCTDFIIESALKLQEFDYEVKKH